jgi:hypothetical protein
MAAIAVAASLAGASSSMFAGASRSVFTGASRSVFTDAGSLMFTGVVLFISPPKLQKIADPTKPHQSP